MVLLPVPDAEQLLICSSIWSFETNVGTVRVPVTVNLVGVVVLAGTEKPGAPLVPVPAMIVPAALEVEL